jgi:multidrug transporter EmrE-like cation transporter
MSTLNIVLLAIAEIFGDFKFKDYARSGSNVDLFSGFVGYGFTIYLLIKTLKSGNILYINGMWDGISAVLESLAAYYILGERLNCTYQYIGLILIIIGLFVFYSGGIAY